MIYWAPCGCAGRTDKAWRRDGQHVKLRSYLMEIGLMDPKEGPSDVIGMLTEAEIRMVCADIGSGQII